MSENPYLIQGPALISFSGGRTSGFMLKHILDAHGGTLPADVHVAFANTGREMPETLDFVQECSERWGVRIVWLEFDPKAPHKIAVVSHIRIVASEAMPTDTVEDWSAVRSPSRAARRRRQGHRQRVIYRQEPRREILYAEAQNLMFMHPVVLREFQAALKRREATNDYWAAVKKALLDVGCRQAAASMGGRR